MAIVKASYTREVESGKANIRYIQNRAGLNGAKIQRTLFSIEGKIERIDAYQMIDEAPIGSYFYRLIINPDPKTEDTRRDIYIWQVAEKTIRGLEGQLGKQIQWIAATHDDHSPLRHAHILAILPRKLNRNDLTLLRDMATEAALEQRSERDKVLEVEQNKERGEEIQWELQR